MKIGRYLVEREIESSGTSSAYYLAYDPELERSVLIQRHTAYAASEPQVAGALARLRQEASALARSNPRVGEILDSGVHDGTPFLVLEYLDRRKLRQGADPSSTFRDYPEREPFQTVDSRGARESGGPVHSMIPVVAGLILLLMIISVFPRLNQPKNSLPAQNLFAGAITLTALARTSDVLGDQISALRTAEANIDALNAQGSGFYDPDPAMWLTGTALVATIQAHERTVAAAETAFAQSLSVTPNAASILVQTLIVHAEETMDVAIQTAIAPAYPAADFPAVAEPEIAPPLRSEPLPAPTNPPAPTPMPTVTEPRPGAAPPTALEPSGDGIVPKDYTVGFGHGIMPEARIDHPGADFSVGDLAYIGAYKTDNLPGSGGNLLEWEILEIRDGAALLISRFGLDGFPYHERNEAVSWEKSSIRKWLNGEFYEKAFSADEKSYILSREVINTDNPEHGTDAGKDTEDKVFLLSYNEVNRFFPTRDDRLLRPTAYAIEQSVWFNQAKETTWWWLRTPGVHPQTAMFVRDDGDFSVAGGRVDSPKGAIRPAIWVRISGADSSGSDISIQPGSKWITFGRYEQDNSLANGSEPIRWKILNVTSEYALLLSEKILDLMPFDTSGRGVTWESCTLRRWLNNDFLNTAFTPEERRLILNEVIINHDNTVEGTDSGNDTIDSVFLLSADEVAQFMPAMDFMETDLTTYANSRHKDIFIGYDFIGGWWLRTMGGSSSSAAWVNHRPGTVNMEIDHYGYGVGFENGKVRPAIRLRLTGR